MTTPRQLPVTVVIATKNEERNLRDCLDSVRFARQVIVVDSQSKDRTIEIAISKGAEVHQFHYDGDWPKKRNWALSNLAIKNEWILVLDADERVSPSLCEEISQAIHTPDVDAFYLQWKFMHFSCLFSNMFLNT